MTYKKIKCIEEYHVYNQNDLIDGKITNDTETGKFELKTEEYSEHYTQYELELILAKIKQLNGGKNE